MCKQTAALNLPTASSMAKENCLPRGLESGTRGSVTLGSGTAAKWNSYAESKTTHTIRKYLRDLTVIGFFVYNAIKVLTLSKKFINILKE